MLSNPDLLTKVEAEYFLSSGGNLPDNFTERIKNFIKFYKCSNCDGRLCMGCVMREYDHECADDCPFYCT